MVTPTSAAAVPPTRVSRQFSLRHADSPTRLRLASAGTALLAVLLAVVGFAAIDRRANAIDAAAGSAEQLIRVQDVRVLVTQADSLAANAYLQGKEETPEQRAAYDDRIAAATAGLVATAGAADGAEATGLENANGLMARYVGLIEQARANNRQGFPVGAAYQRQARTVASELVGQLRDVEQLTRARVESDVSRSYSASWPFVLVTLAVAAALVLGSLWLARRWKRLVNVPIAVATLIVALVLVVGLFVNARAAANAGDALREPLTAADLLAQARGAAFDARSNEALTLINRGNGAAYETEWLRSMSIVDNALEQSCNDHGVGCDLGSGVGDYRAAHVEVRSLDDSGDWDGAVAIVNDAESPLTTSFESVADGTKSALDEQISDATAAFSDAASPLGTLRVLVALAGIAVAFLAARGYGQRVREYR
jgi:hypothetical protein